MIFERRKLINILLIIPINFEPINEHLFDFGHPFLASTHVFFHLFKFVYMVRWLRCLHHYYCCLGFLPFDPWFLLELVPSSFYYYLHLYICLLLSIQNILFASKCFLLSCFIAFLSIKLFLFFYFFLPKWLLGWESSMLLGLNWSSIKFILLAS